MGHAALYLFSRVFGLLGPRARLHDYVLVAQPVPAQPLLAPRGGKAAFDIRQIEQHEYHSDWFPRPRQVIDSRYRQGAVCFVAFKQQRAVACLWLKQGAFYEDEVRCRFVPLPEGVAVWDFDVYIDPQLRLGRLFVYLWDHAYQWLRQRGARWTVSRINAFNTGSMRPHRSLGARKIGNALFLGFGQWQLLLATNRPYLHLSRRATPDMPLRAPSD